MIVIYQGLFLLEFKEGEAQQLEVMSNLGPSNRFSEEQINRYINLRRWKLHSVVSEKKRWGGRRGGVAFAMFVWKPTSSKM